MLGTRILTAVVLVPLVLAALFVLPPAGWGLASLAFIVIASMEWANLVGYRGWTRLLYVGGTIAIGLTLLAPSVTGFDRGWPDGLVFAVCGVAALFWLFAALPWLAYRWRPASKPVLGITGWIVLIGAWVAVVTLQARSPTLVLAAMAIVWIADTAAYFTGRKFGKKKLAPLVSPGKSWEGVYGGLAAVTVYALILVPLAASFGYEGPISIITVLACVVAFVAIAALSVVGDLYESLLKRQAGVKDSGTLLPGHGGVLDRIDALLSAMPAAALMTLVWLR
jgi:phosphatidate cytidylyltransferase